MSVIIIGINVFITTGQFTEKETRSVFFGSPFCFVVLSKHGSVSPVFGSSNGVIK